MFGTNSLPLPSPSTFAHEHRPLRLTSEVARPQPQGPCHFILLHPTQQNQRCSCQGFHHNRSAPGNICDCGHQACYHLHHSPTQDTNRPHESVSYATEHALYERIKRLEETIQREREVRENDLARQKQMWEREVRILREALAPFYKSEQDMRRKQVELEDRVEGNFDEQVRLKDRVVALDDANMHVEKRVEELEGRGKRRRISRQTGVEDNVPNGVIPDGPRISNNPDEHSVYSSSSRALSPNSNYGVGQGPAEARSSGILNLIEAPRPILYPPPPPVVRRSISHDRDDPRSSGFLALDLAERMGSTNVNEHSHSSGHPPVQAPVREKTSPPDYAQSDPDQPMMRRRSPSFSLPPPPPATTYAGPRNGMKISLAEMSPRKRKHLVEHLALDVLADASIASPLIQ